MGDQLHTMLNITIYYPDEKGFWKLISGQTNKIIVRVEKSKIPDHFLNKDYLNDETFRSEFQKWITSLWVDKDALIERLESETQV